MTLEPGYYEARHNAAVLCRMWCREVRYIEARLEAVRGTDVAPQDVVLVQIEAPVSHGAGILGLLEDIVSGRAAKEEQ